MYDLLYNGSPLGICVGALLLLGGIWHTHRMYSGRSNRLLLGVCTSAMGLLFVVLAAVTMHFKAEAEFALRNDWLHMQPPQMLWPFAVGAGFLTLCALVRVVIEGQRKCSVACAAYAMATVAALDVLLDYFHMQSYKDVWTWTNVACWTVTIGALVWMIIAIFRSMRRTTASTRSIAYAARALGKH
jgi:hypothetical protein